MRSWAGSKTLGNKWQFICSEKTTCILFSFARSRATILTSQFTQARGNLTWMGLSTFPSLCIVASCSLAMTIPSQHPVLYGKRAAASLSGNSSRYIATRSSGGRQGNKSNSCGHGDADISMVWKAYISPVQVAECVDSRRKHISKGKK